MTEITAIDLAWLAGWLEGEGCFSDIGNGVPRIQVSVTDEDVLRRGAKLMGASHRVKQYSPKTLNRKPIWSVRIHSNQAIELMKKLFPFLGSRRQAKIIEVLRAEKQRPGIARGERSGRSKLTEQDVVNIRREVGNGWSARLIAKAFGVTKTTILSIKNHKTWKHVMQ